MMRCVSPADGSLSLSQDRFGIDPSSRDAPGWSQVWRVPVVERPAAGETQRIIVSAQQPVTLPDQPVPLLNAGQTGYFISRYAPQAWGPLLEELPRLSAQDQLGLFGDTSALARAGYSPMSSLLEFVEALPADADPAVWTVVSEDLVALARRRDDPTQARAYRGWLRKELNPVLARVGWDTQPGEGGNLTTLRATLLKALSEADDEAVIAEARTRFERFAANPDTLTGDARATILAVVTLHAQQPTWDRLHAIAHSTREAAEREELYEALGGARDPDLARRALQLVLSGDAPATAAQRVMEAVAVRHADIAFDFVVSHWDRISPMITPGYLSGFAPKIAAESDRTETASQLSEFAVKVGPACDPGEVRRAISRIHYRARIRQQRIVEMDRWLSDRSPSS
jgi:aminopeptidase N